MSVDPEAKFTVVHPGTAEVISWRAKMHLLAGADTSGSKLTVIETENGPAGGPPLHRHEREDEAFFVLGGDYTFVCAEETTAAGPGSFVYLPKGLPHRYRAGESGGRLLMLFIPSGIEGYFRALAAQMDEGAIDPLAARALAESFGLELFEDY